MAVTMREIKRLVAAIGREFQPQQIVLFGSYVYGQPQNDSDVDLLVVMPFEGPAAYKALETLERVDPPFAVDLIVRTPQEVQERLAWNDYFLREITEHGMVLYEAAHVGVG